MIDRNAILQKPRPRKEVTMPEWGCTVFVRTLSAREFIRLNERMKADPDHATYHSLIVSVVTDEGAPVFGDDDAPALADQPWQVVSRLAEAFNELNGSKDDAAKNSATH